MPAVRIAKYHFFRCYLISNYILTNTVVQKQEFSRILAQQVAAPVSTQVTQPSCCTKQLFTAATLVGCADKYLRAAASRRGY